MSSSLAELCIRRMIAADVARVLSIAEALPDAPHWRKEAYLNALDPSGVPQRVALVAEAKGGVVVGFAVASLLAPEAELETIAIAAEAQHRGIACRLFASLLGELKTAQVTELLLEARASNHPALTLYRSLGFEQSGCRLRYYIDPVEDAVLMRLKLR